MTRNRPWQWLSGLRPRLLAAFALATVLGAAAASGASYVSARNTMLGSAQDDFMNEIKRQVTETLPQLSVPPGQADLEQLAGALTGSTLVTYEDSASSGRGLPLSSVPRELRDSLKGNDHIEFQRVLVDEVPMFYVGMPVLAPDATGASRPTGIEVYASMSLSDEQRAIEELAQWAWLTVALVFPLAAALALLAARGVLRPVRQLNVAARRLAEGKLDTRLRARGSDELADLVNTFNETAVALDRTVGELRQMEAAARRFVADVSHELRTPLTAMSAVTGVLDEDAGQLPPDTAVAARLVSEETRKLARLVQDLIEISRFDTDRADLRLDDWDLATAIGDSLAARGWRDSPDLVTELPEGIGARVDRRRLDVIVANLVGNALRHGGPPVEVKLRADAAMVLVEVSDHGPGIDPAVLPHVFERFYKADSARARSDGSGLGLAIALENARMHGGGIYAENRPEGGARFTLHLPRFTEVAR
ncbi:sensor histidine kinase [Amycolatopsis magusensis]|uniref:histidine kinase n=1 Tax=Amycolatopsis magusensis TaxID=882444 RepID=A0ABS4PIZ1_9PSEU|nr:HAMP domain-containing sensor histidine kinase [Amycolatopsis magusensis]MBP2179384.1 two-component system sensor histidine kinase MtrB [Amycolatopsis magusensis]MDI5977343.1 HAMP domain-containing sensor histidine kinase [Amycolatopsis magusensis]